MDNFLDPRYRPSYRTDPSPYRIEGELVANQMLRLLDAVGLFGEQMPHWANEALKLSARDHNGELEAPYIAMQTGLKWLAEIATKIADAVKDGGTIGKAEIAQLAKLDPRSMLRPRGRPRVEGGEWDKRVNNREMRDKLKEFWRERHGTEPLDMQRKAMERSEKARHAVAQRHLANQLKPSTAAQTVASAQQDHWRDQVEGDAFPYLLQQCREGAKPYGDVSPLAVERAQQVFLSRWDADPNYLPINHAFGDMIAALAVAEQRKLDAEAASGRSDAPQ